MTNEEKYKSAEERKKAHKHYCRRIDECPKKDDGCRLGCAGCAFRWLTLEAEETKPEPCYGCGRELTERDLAHKAEQAGEYSGWSFHCPQCGYRSPYATSKDDAIAAHNRVARAVRAARESEGASKPRECLKEAISIMCCSCKNWYGKCIAVDGRECNVIAKWRKVAGSDDRNLTAPQPVRPPDVQGDVDLKGQSLTALPLQPENVGGDFFCAMNQLTSLDGAPQSVGGDFSCDHNQLTSLAGAPMSVGEDFWCTYNKLTSLDGAPVKVGGDVFCGGNQLTQQQVDDYKAFLAAGGNDHAHIDDTGHYCEKARESEVSKCGATLAEIREEGGAK